MDLPFVSIVIITWNRKEEVLETIAAVFKQTYPYFEIIMVDNGSSDDTIEAVQLAYPAVKIISLGQNLGIGARNAGIKIAQGDIILCLDSDASVGQESMANLVTKFQAEPRIGVINSKILNSYTKQLVNGPGWSYTEKDKEDQDKEFLSYTFSEGGVAIRRKIFAEIGPFWELLFFGCEGQEFSLRVLDAGYDILYFPGSIVYHREAKQSRVSDDEKYYFYLRNALYIYLVRFPWWLMGIFMPLKIGAFLVSGSRRGHLRQVLRSLLEFVRQIPFLLKQRRPIRNETAHLYLKLQRQHGSLRWDLPTWLKNKA
jgi:GT2 family glycosyltransferase